jgi:hypothetical protein
MNGRTPGKPRTEAVCLALPPGGPWAADSPGGGPAGRAGRGRGSAGTQGTAPGGPRIEEELP